MSAIMQATGLKKGGIYNHFKSKDDLALAVFDYAVEQVSRRYVNAIREQAGAIAQLTAIVHTFCTAIDEVEMQGGCPLMNTAIDSDDTHPALRDRVKQAMTRWRELIIRVVNRGIHGGGISPSTNPDAVATILISTLEGSLMLTRLYGDRTHLNYAKTHLEHYLSTLINADGSTLETRKF